MRKITYAQAALEAMQEEFRRDVKTIYLASGGDLILRQEFGEARVKDAPISESAFVGAAIGLAGCGFRPVVNVQMATFAFVATDQIVNHAAKLTYMFGGQVHFPIVYRMGVGAGLSAAAQHSVNPYSMYMSVPGLKIILPSTPCDFKGLLKTAIRCNSPVLCFEHMALSQFQGEVPEGEYTIPLGKAEIRKKGSDITVVALGKMIYEALAAAEELESQGISLEIIDPRTLVPLDRQAILSSVSKTGRLLVVDEACQTCGVAAEIISLVVEDRSTFHFLKAHPIRVCGLDVPIPFSPPMERYVLPNKRKIIAAVKDIMRVG